MYKGLDPKGVGRRDILNNILTKKRASTIFTVTVVTVIFLYIYYSDLLFAASIDTQFTAARKSLNCSSPVINFAFTKTHKTGSTTLSNILLRFSENKRTNLLLDWDPEGSTEYKNLLRHRYYPPPANQNYNAFVMHADYNPAFLSTKLPTDTVFFSLIRHPISRYISAFHFFGTHKKYCTRWFGLKTCKDPFSHFDESVQKHLSVNKQYMIDSTSCKDCAQTVDTVARDMGFDFNKYFNAQNRDTYLQNFLQQRSATFSLVLLAEYFDLSLVLLKRKFCWELEDILYFRSLESSAKPFVTEETKEKIGQLQKIDTAIFNHFNKTFWHHVNQEQGIMEELKEFQKLRQSIVEKCVLEGKTTAASLGFNKLGDILTNQLTQYGLENYQCKAMNTRVISFSHLIGLRNQRLRVDKSKIKQDAGTLTIEDVWAHRPS